MGRKKKGALSRAAILADLGYASSGLKGQSNQDEPQRREENPIVADDVLVEEEVIVDEILNENVFDKDAIEGNDDFEEVDIKELTRLMSSVNVDCNPDNFEEQLNLAG